MSLSQNPSRESQSPGLRAAVIFDHGASLDQTGNDPELLAELIVVFLEQLGRLLPPLAEAVERRDASAIRKTAHLLVSSVSVLNAPPLRDSARRLEVMGLNSDLASIETAHAEVLRDVDLLKQALAASDATKAA